MRFIPEWSNKRVSGTELSGNLLDIVEPEILPYGYATAD